MVQGDVQAAQPLNGFSVLADGCCRDMGMAIAIAPWLHLDYDDVAGPHA